MLVTGFGSWFFPAFSLSSNQFGSLKQSTRGCNKTQEVVESNDGLRPEKASQIKEQKKNCAALIFFLKYIDKLKQIYIYFKSIDMFVWHKAPSTEDSESNE